MLPKTFTLRQPIDTKLVVLEQFLSYVSKNGVRIAQGSYTGKGDAMELTIPFAPLVMVIMQKPIATATSPISSALVLWSKLTPNWAWVSSSDTLVRDILTLSNTQTMSIGVNATINTRDTEYQYILLG